MTVTQSDLAGALTRGRAAMRGLYTDTCRITKPGEGATTQDEATLQITYPPRVTVYEGPCRMQVKADINSNVVETTAGEREWTYLTSQLQLPVSNEELASFPNVIGSPGDVATDHQVEYLTAPYDASLPGRKFVIAGPYHKSHAVYRRFRVKEAV